MKCFLKFVNPITKKIKNSTVYYQKSEDFPVIFKINENYFCNNDYSKECSTVPGLPFKYTPVIIDKENNIAPNTESFLGNFSNSNNNNKNKSHIIPEISENLIFPTVTQNLGTIPMQTSPDLGLSSIGLTKLPNDVKKARHHYTSFWNWVYVFLSFVITSVVIRVLHCIFLFLPYFGHLNDYLNTTTFFIYVFRGQAAMLDYIDRKRHNIVRVISERYNIEKNKIKNES